MICFGWLGVGLKLAFLMPLLKDVKSAPPTSLKPPMFEETSSSSASRAMPHFQKLISNLKVRFSKLTVIATIKTGRELIRKGKKKKKKLKQLNVFLSHRSLRVHF